MTRVARSWAIVLLAAGCVMAVHGAAGTGSSKREFSGGVIEQMPFPGRIVDWAAEDRDDGLEMLVLVEPREPEVDPPAEEETDENEAQEPDPEPLPPCEDDELRTALTLYRWSVSSGRAPVAIRDDLPHDASRIASVDLDGDGVRETVVDTPGGRIRIGIDAEADHLVLARSELSALGDGRVVVVEPGLLTVFAPRLDGAYHEIGNTRLRVEARAGRWRTTIFTRGVTPIGLTAQGDRLLAMPADAIGTRRVRIGLIRIPDDAEIVVEECWARLPEPEDVLESAVVLFDGVPLLVTTTKEAGRLGFLVEKRLRVHPLLTDRSRLGVEPLFAVGSRMNLWQEARFFSPDVDGDGRADLAVAYWKGLKDSRVVIDVYLRNEDGSFRTKASSTAFDVEDGDRSWLRYGDDLDGDGRPDLMIRSGNALHVHRGLASVKGAKLVDRGPIEVPLEDDDGGENTISVTIGGGDEGIRSWSNDDGPTVVDLAPGADGPRAIVARGTAQDGRDLLRIVRLDGRGD